jgi:hypothetical protein
VTRTIVVDVDGLRITARLLEDAPRMAERLWSALPVETALRQSRWSGESTYASIPELAAPEDQRERTEIPAEHPATFMYPGRMYAGAATGGIGLPYGEAQSRDAGLNTWITEVAELVGDHTAFLAMLARVRREGRKTLRITRGS